MGRLKREVEAKNKRCATRFKRPKIKGVYLRTVTKDSEVYDVSLVVDGERRSKRLTIANDTTNIDFVKQVEGLQNSIKAECEANAIPDFSTLLDRYCLERGLAQNTILMMRASLRGFGLDDKANRQSVEELKTSTQYTDGTKKTKLKAIKGFYEWLKSSCKIQVANPVEGMKIPRQIPRQRIPTKDETDRLVAYIAHFKKSELDLLYLRLLIATGARCSTIESVRVCDMDSEWRLSLYNKKMGRRYALKVPITDKDTRELWDRCKEGKDPSNLLFDATFGERLRARMGRLFEKDSYGETLSPHSFRHLKATDLANSGIPVKTASAILDCSPTVLVSVYTTVQQEDVDRAMATVSQRQLPKW